MNSTDVIVSINSMKDIENITDNTKYINLSINNVDVNVIDYFLLHGQNYMYTDTIDNKNGFIYANYDMFKSGEAIIDNILNNFMRYAKKKIKITVKNNKIILYNDGPNIDKEVLTNIFTPYEKGVKGVFGLGLSIVKKTLAFLDYDINIVNEKNGVKFIIS